MTLAVQLTSVGLPLAIALSWVDQSLIARRLCLVELCSTSCAYFRTVFFSVLFSI
jgi:hypothetical protein